MSLHDPEDVTDIDILEKKRIEDKFNNIKKRKMSARKISLLTKGLGSKSLDTSLSGIVRTIARRKIDNCIESTSLNTLSQDISTSLTQFRKLVVEQINAYGYDTLDFIAIGKTPEEQFIYRFFFDKDIIDEVIVQEYHDEILKRVDDEIAITKQIFMKNCVTLKESGHLGGREQTKRIISELIRKYFWLPDFVLPVDTERNIRIERSIKTKYFTEAKKYFEDKKDPRVLKVIRYLQENPDATNEEIEKYVRSLPMIETKIQATIPSEVSGPATTFRPPEGARGM